MRKPRMSNPSIDELEHPFSARAGTATPMSSSRDIEPHKKASQRPSLRWVDGRPQTCGIWLGASAGFARQISVEGLCSKFCAEKLRALILPRNLARCPRAQRGEGL